MTYLDVFSASSLISFGHPKLKYQEKCPFILTLCPLSKFLQPEARKVTKVQNIILGVIFLYIQSVSDGGGISVNGLELANLAPNLCDGWKS